MTVARRVTNTLQNGHLQRYLWLLVALAIAAGSWPFFAPGPSAKGLPLNLDGLSLGVAAVWFVGVTAALAVAAAHRQRLLALVLLGAAWWCVWPSSTSQRPTWP